MFRCSRAVALIFATLLLNACTVIPQAEFKAYRDAFDGSRSVVQEVRLDYTAAVEEHNRREKDREAEKDASSGAKGLPQFRTKFESKVEK
ncbi:MAG: hypothetical protein JWO68_4057 [Actinomycetia bacterium]|nr:hypothetical protein [Actinomycetes bacterium]